MRPLCVTFIRHWSCVLDVTYLLLLIACIDADVTFLYQFIHLFLPPLLFPLSPLSPSPFTWSCFFPPISQLSKHCASDFPSSHILLSFFSFCSSLTPFLSPPSLCFHISSLPLLRCWKVSQSVSRQISAFIWTGHCCRTARLLKAPPKAASERWPWSSRPPTHPRVTRWSTPGTSSLPSILYPGDP